MLTADIALLHHTIFYTTMPYRIIVAVFVDRLAPRGSLGRTPDRVSQPPPPPRLPPFGGRAGGARGARPYQVRPKIEGSPISLPPVMTWIMNPNTLNNLKP